jgi:hypothetical protein
MPHPPTARMGLVSIAGGDQAHLVDDHMKDLVDDIDPQTAIFAQGTLASRPVSTPGTPGKQGRLYYATDQSIVYYDHGTGWIAVGAKTPLAELAITPMARAFNSGDIGVTTGGTVLPFNSESYDTGVAAGFSAMHDTATNNSRVVAPVTGVYAVYFRCKYVPNAVGNHVELTIRTNGVSNGASERVATVANDVGLPPLYDEVSLNATDYIELVATAFGGAATMKAGSVLGMSLISRAS